MGIPVTKTVVQVPGASVIPMPIRIPPSMALGISAPFGILKINSLLERAPIAAPPITPMFTIKANKKALLVPVFPTIGRKLLPPIQNLWIDIYIITFSKAKPAINSKGFFHELFDIIRPSLKIEIRN